MGAAVDEACVQERIGLRRDHARGRSEKRPSRRPSSWTNPSRPEPFGRTDVAEAAPRPVASHCGGIGDVGVRLRGRTGGPALGGPDHADTAGVVVKTTTSPRRRRAYRTLRIDGRRDQDVDWPGGQHFEDETAADDTADEDAVEERAVDETAAEDSAEDVEDLKRRRDGRR